MNLLDLLSEAKAFQFPVEACLAVQSVDGRSQNLRLQKRSSVTFGSNRTSVSFKNLDGIIRLASFLGLTVYGLGVTGC